MICINCGSTLREGAHFCVKCGSTTQPKEDYYIPQTNQHINLVPAKCTSCGADLSVDSSLQAAICPYCNNAYIVKSAINNYNVKVNGGINVGSATINVSGHNSTNLLRRAQGFEDERDLKNALNYYNRILDIDINNKSAQAGVERVTEKLKNHAHFETEAALYFTKGCLQLRHERLFFAPNNSNPSAFNINKIGEIKTGAGAFRFRYERRLITFSVKFRYVSKWEEAINNAKKGVYSHPNFII